MEIRPVQESDRAFWFTLDQHLPKEQFDQKVREKLGYVLSVDGVAVGLMRYNFSGTSTLSVRCCMWPKNTKAEAMVEH